MARLEWIYKLFDGQRIGETSAWWKCPKCGGTEDHRAGNRPGDYCRHCGTRVYAPEDAWWVPKEEPTETEEEKRARWKIEDDKNRWNYLSTYKRITKSWEECGAWYFKRARWEEKSQLLKGLQNLETVLNLPERITSPNDWYTVDVIAEMTPEFLSICANRLKNLEDELEFEFLKPCQKCGGKAKVEVRYVGSKEGGMEIHEKAFCTKCGDSAEFLSIYGQTVKDPMTCSRRSITKYWNSRGI